MFLPCVSYHDILYISLENRSKPDFVLVSDQHHRLISTEVCCSLLSGSVVNRVGSFGDSPFIRLIRIEELPPWRCVCRDGLLHHIRYRNIHQIAWKLHICRSGVRSCQYDKRQHLDKQKNRNEYLIRRWSHE